MVCVPTDHLPFGCSILPSETQDSGKVSLSLRVVCWIGFSLSFRRRRNPQKDIWHDKVQKDSSCPANDRNYFIAVSAAKSRREPICLFLSGNVKL
jgi:hypothetical protein